jgi:hypothetical protein
LSTWAGGLCAVTFAFVSYALEYNLEAADLTSSSTNLDVESVDAQFLASDSNILSSQHSSVWGGLVTVGLDLHASSHTSDGFAATGITQDVSL